MLCYWGYQPTVTVTFHSRTWVGNHLDRLKEFSYQCISDHIQCKMNNRTSFSGEFPACGFWIPTIFPTKKQFDDLEWTSNSSNNFLHQMVILQLSSTKRPSFFRSVFDGCTTLLSIDEMVKPSPFLGIFFFFQLSMMDL